LIALLGSLIALLFAAAGMVRHIRRQRKQLHTLEPAGATSSTDETDLESH
jgi:hypothetical protein